MCRLMVFSGTCQRCGYWYEWDELRQELSCLEAKNIGFFGSCRRGINREEHSFDQECEPCALSAEVDEGFGGMEDEVTTHQEADKGKKKTKEAQGGSKKKKQRTS